MFQRISHCHVEFLRFNSLATSNNTMLFQRVANVLTRSPFIAARRASSSDVYQLSRDLRLHDISGAQKLVDHFEPDERALLLTILMEKQGVALVENNFKTEHPSISQIRQVFIINTIPFIGFGILDNMIMLLAGEYIDQTLGTLLGISTMAAAALGNIISDVAGVGLAHYVEKIVAKLGFSQPELSPKQLELKQVRFAVNGARAFGLVVGCLIGMFPLLFFSSPNEAANKASKPFPESTSS